MKKNIGTLDSIIRLVLVVIIGILYLTDVIAGTTAIILGIIALIFLVTALISWCPLWWIFGISTRKKKLEVKE